MMHRVRHILRFALAALALLAPMGAAPVPASRQAHNVVVITIEGEIDAVTAYSFKRRLEAAQRMGADAVVVELNTPGGAVMATLEICDAIKNSPVPNTVAWVHTTAYSAGAFIALACREIVVAESATMGDAAPVAMMPGLGFQSLGKTERQKILAPILTEIVDSARRNGYSENLVQSFVTLGVELWLVRDRQTGEQRFVTESEWKTLFSEPPPRGAPARMRSGELAGVPPLPPGEREANSSASAENERSGAASPPPASSPALAPEGQLGFDPASPSIGKSAATEVSEGMSRPSQSRALTEKDRGRFEFVEYVTDGKTLLLLKTGDLERYGFAARTVRNDEELKAFFGASELHRRNATWSESLVVFLTNPYLRVVLIVGLLVSLFIEMAAPGIGLAGGAALVCALLLLAPPVLIGAAGWWTVVAVVAGVVCIVAELLVFPGVMALGLAGGLLLMAGLVGSFVTGDSGQMGAEITHGLALTMLGVFVAGVAMYFIGKTYGTLPIFNRLILSGAGSGGEEEGAGLLAAMAPLNAGAVRVGAQGVATTALRPAGSAEFEGRIVDVVSEIGFVEKGGAVRIVSASPYRVGVEPLRGNAGAGGEA